jgi:tetratricopeptide (TPR) repeat protein
MGWFVYRKNKTLFKAYILFFIMFWSSIAFFLQVFIPLDYTVAARWIYFPMIGLLGMLGIFVQELPYYKKFQKIFIVFFVIIIVLLSYRTNLRNTYWSDNIRLFSTAVNVDDNYSNENQLADAYYNAGDYLDSLSHVDASIALFPYDNNLTMKSLVEDKIGDHNSAVYFAQKAYAANNYGPNLHDANTYMVLGKLLIQNNDNLDAKKVLEKGIQEYPKSSYILILDAYNDYLLGNKTEAVVDLQNAKIVHPNNKVINALFNSINSSNAFNIVIQ